VVKGGLTEGRGEEEEKEEKEEEEEEGKTTAARSALSIMRDTYAYIGPVHCFATRR
jgi:hypothetical protein